MISDWRKLLSGTDIRGEEHDLTDEFAARFGYAFALWLAKRLETTPDRLTIAVGHDPRASGPRIERALIRGMTAADCDVLQCGLSTTPAIFMTLFGDDRRADGAITITASSGAPNINGLKLMSREGPADADDVRAMLEDAMRVKVPARLVTRAQPLTDYMDRLAAVVRERLDDDVPKPLIGLRVVVDAGNGAGGAFAQFLENLGAETEGSQFLEPDGSFPNHAPDPSDPAALASLSKAVLAAQADLGVLFDADCDRAAFVDQSGREIAGNRLIALISAVLLAENPGATIVTDSVTSSGLTSFIAGWGGTHYRFKRGYRNVIEEARRLSEEGIDCPLAIETSGHAAFRDNHYLDDGMYLATRLICEAHDRKRFGETLSSLIDDLAEPVESCEIRFKVTDADVQQASSDAIELILSHTLDNPCWRLATDSREGVRILFNLDCGMENAWFQLRMSVHDPAMMVLNAESDVPGGVGSMLGELYVLLQDCAGIDLQPLKRALEN